MGFVNATEGFDSAAPSEITVAREFFEVAAIILVPGGWFLSTFLSYLILLCLTDQEMENMVFVYKRNEQFGGCWLSKKEKATPIEEQRGEEEKPEKKNCFLSFLDVQPQAFDLTGEWIDLHEVFW